MGDCMHHRASDEAKLGHTAELNAHVVAENVRRQRRGEPLLAYPHGAVGALGRSPRIFCVSLGKHDGALAFNSLVLTGVLPAVAKRLIEWTKVAAMAERPAGVLFWTLADWLAVALTRTLLPLPPAAEAAEERAPPAPAPEAAEEDRCPRPRSSERNATLVIHCIVCTGPTGPHMHRSTAQTTRTARAHSAVGHFDDDAVPRLSIAHAVERLVDPREWHHLDLRLHAVLDGEGEHLLVVAERPEVRAEERALGGDGASGGTSCERSSLSGNETQTRRPSGFSSSKYGSSGARPLAVLRITSKVPRAACICAASDVTTKPAAPKPRASSSFSAERDSATISHPIALPNWSARWPRPPMPMMPTRSPAFAWRFSGEKVVIPAHINGPTNDISKPAGVRNTHSLGYRIRDAKPPLSLPLPA